MYIHASYLEEFLAPRHFFFITITKITMHNIKLIITTVVTAPAIAGTGVEFEVDEPVIGDKGITTRIRYTLYHSLKLIHVIGSVNHVCIFYIHSFAQIAVKSKLHKF